MVARTKTHFRVDDDFVFYVFNRGMESGSYQNSVLHEDWCEVFLPDFIPILILDFCFFPGDRVQRLEEGKDFQ